MSFRIFISLICKRKMIRCVKCSVLQSVSIVNIRVERFHLTSQTSIRSALRKNRNAEGKHVEYPNTPGNPQNSNVNFLGIEGEEGVITINSKLNSVEENSMMRKFKEKFCRASFGVIRYDSNNKLKLHGQYEERKNFSFPYCSNDSSEVSRDFTKRTSKVFDATPNNAESFYNYSVKNCTISESKIYSSNNVIEMGSSDSYSSGNSCQDANHIDQYYFTNFCEEEREESVPNINDTPLADELNYFDNIYFSNFTNSKTQKSCQKPVYSKNSQSIKETNTDCNKRNLLAINSEKTFDVNLQSDYNEGGEFSPLQDNPNDSFLKCNGLQDIHFNEVNANESKRKNISDSDKNVIIKQLNGEVHDANTKSNTDSVDGTQDSLSKENHSQFEDDAKLYAQSNVQSFNNINNYLPKTIKSFESKKVAEKESVVTDGTTAYDFIKNLEENQNIKKGYNKVLDVKFDSKGFRILKNQVQDLSYFTQDEIISLLKQNILYSDDDLLILNKPYNLVMHDSQTTKLPCLSTYLDELAKEINQSIPDPKLYTVHRLDKETTGCVILARNESMAQNLKSLFAQRKIIKKYWILTSRVPNPPEGVISIPVAEGSVNNKKRMVLHPDIPKDIQYRNHSKRGKPAITSYKVLSESGNAALVEAMPVTGIKHQIRVHFGFGLDCPILGDHKYSHLDKLVPQKLPCDILQKLHVRQSKVRYIPLHMHAKSVTIPGYFEKQDLNVKAPLPKHMKDNLKMLKFRK